MYSDLKYNQFPIDDRFYWECYPLNISCPFMGLDLSNENVKKIPNTFIDYSFCCPDWTNLDKFPYIENTKWIGACEWNNYILYGGHNNNTYDTVYMITDRNHNILNVICEEGCSLQLGDCGISTYLWNEQDLILYNSGDVESLISIITSESKD